MTHKLLILAQSRNEARDWARENGMHWRDYVIATPYWSSSPLRGYSFSKYQIVGAPIFLDGQIESLIFKFASSEENLGTYRRMVEELGERKAAYAKKREEYADHTRLAS